MGLLSPLSAVDLGKEAVHNCLSKLKLEVDEIFIGNVLQAGQGQNIARQIGLSLGLTCPATTINKVCASGLKAIELAALSLQFLDVVVAGGTESMSNAPHLVHCRNPKFGSMELVDHILRDGLTDQSNQTMGYVAEKTVNLFKITRESQDEHAILSYSRAEKATKNQSFEELVPITVPAFKKEPEKVINLDEEVMRCKIQKIPHLKPSFEGTITPATSSKLSDGAAALCLVSERKANDFKRKFKIIGMADIEQDPKDFCTSPSLAILKALKQAKLKLEDVDFFEINEAFSVVVLSNLEILKLEISKVNVFGGAVSLGHPLGCSGARIVCTLLTILDQKKARYGCAAICNGGGGASAIVVERM